MWFVLSLGSLKCAVDPLRGVVERESIKKPRREGERNMEAERTGWGKQNTGDFSATDRKDEGMSKDEKKKTLKKNTRGALKKLSAEFYSL